MAIYKDLITDSDYKIWLTDIKSRIRNVQIKAALKVNAELLNFYWELGADIVVKQEKTTWGDGFLQQLSKDLMTEFPEMKGFSERNLKYVRQWYWFYTYRNKAVASIRQQPVAQLQNANKIRRVTGRMGQSVIAQITQIPWGHNITIITKCKIVEEALYYVQNTLAHNWSRSVLVHQIENGSYQREGKSINNFSVTLPKPQSDLAKETLKDPYIFDFMSMTKAYNERDLENGLINHITNFLLELGAGFAFVGRQVRVLKQ